MIPPRANGNGFCLDAPVNASFIGSALLALALVAGCQGKLGERTSDEGDGLETAPGEEFEPAFTAPDSQPQLLPFWVRLQRVASVVDRPLDDAIFDTLEDNRMGLGDYDYASGVKPDRMWSPARMALWAKSLRPVCASDAMHARFPNLSTSNDERLSMASIAWGREVAASELAFDTPTFTAVPEAERYDTICLAILSAAEFVIQ